MTTSASGRSDLAATTRCRLAALNAAHFRHELRETGHRKPAIIRQQLAAAAQKLRSATPADLARRREHPQLARERACIEIARGLAARHEDSGTSGRVQEAGRLNSAGLTGALMVNAVTRRSSTDSPRTRTVVPNAT